MQQPRPNLLVEAAFFYHVQQVFMSKDLLNDFFVFNVLTMQLLFPHVVSIMEIVNIIKRFETC